MSVEYYPNPYRGVFTYRAGDDRDEVGGNTNAELRPGLCEIGSENGGNNVI